jgi:hypothetical protein
LSASGFPVPFSIRESVEADTAVTFATSRRLSPSSSRLRFIALPSSSVSTSDLIDLFVVFIGSQATTRWVLVARLCPTLETHPYLVLLCFVLLFVLCVREDDVERTKGLKLLRVD